MPAYDFIPAWHETGACMDIRHIGWIYELLIRMKPTRTLEVGSHTGCSSSAFIAAGVPDAHFAEISPNDKFLSVVSGKGTVHQRKGAHVLMDEDPFDVVLLDGAHDLESVKEEWEAMQGKLPRVLILHDVFSAQQGYPHCEGPAWLYEEMPTTWECFSDNAKREGEATHRGLAIFVRDGQANSLLSANAVHAAFASQCW